MRILTVLGTRPEIIRLSRIIPLLDDYCEHRVLHTGQNFSKSLNEIFFEQLQLRPPDQVLHAAASTPMQQISKILTGVEADILTWKPDRLLILGDTNSALSAFVAKRMGIPVFHMEAGNRCFDDRVPEEVNRRLIDHASDVLMPYTERSRHHLIQEGIHCSRIRVTGNPIYEVLQYYAPQISASSIHHQLHLKSQHYFLVTLHREENVDQPERLHELGQCLNQIAVQYDLPIICSTHPRTQQRLEKLNLAMDSRIQWLPPFGLFDFIALEQGAFCVLTDSGTVQEECALFRVPNVTLRDVTERQETLECGSNILSGIAQKDVLRAIKLATQTKPDWEIPAGYLTADVSHIVARIVLGHDNLSSGERKQRP